MKVSAVNGNVLCRVFTPAAENVEENGLAYCRQNFPLYVVVEDSGEYRKGDVVASSTRGSRFKDDGIEYCIFRTQDIAGKICG